MADFSTPFAGISGEMRLPTPDEQQGGFPCGALSLPLFNKLFNQLQSEVGAVAVEAGITQDDGDDTILVQSILALIAAATGGGSASNYVLMSQARARLPIFPDVQTADGRFGVTSPSDGTIRIPAGVTFLHRGIFTITSAETDLATAASKVYHVRWNPTDGFVIKDLADVAYNPSALSETNATFDSKYDDMLIARVTTNSSNVPTIRNLSNMPRLAYQADSRVSLPGALTWTSKTGTGFALDWARTPLLFDATLTEFRSNNTGPGGITPENKGIIRATGIRLVNKSRYGMDDYEYYYEDTKAGTSTDDGLFAASIQALAV